MKGFAFAFALLAGLQLAPAAALAQWERPLYIVVPFPAGGPTDVIARLLAPKLAVSLGRPVVVENKVGAAGGIGAAFVARAPTDGNTLLMGTSFMAVSPSLTANHPFDPIGDFAPISLVAAIESVLVVHPDVPAANVRELVAYARANPGKLAYATAGTGSTYHLAAELFAARTGIRMMHVPYKGAAPAIQDVLAGHVALMFDNMSSAVPNIKAGRVRALGVASLRRSALLPDVPTIDEQGVTGFETTIWLGLFAPKGTPEAVLRSLHKAIADAVNSPDYRDKLAAIDMQPRVSTAAELKQTLRSDLAKWAKVVKDAGIKPE